MNLNSFSYRQQERILPIFILADTSGSMEGVKISILNNALREMIHTLASVTDIRGAFHVCIITFGEDVNIHQSLDDVNQIRLTELKAYGRTPMGEAINLVVSMINDENVVPITAFTPTIVLVSDGIPTDIPNSDVKNDYQKWEPIKSLLDPNNRASKSMRLAMGIGEDADKEMLRIFISNDTIRVFESNEASAIEKFFQWVTMTSINRMTGNNPNNSSFSSFFDLDDDDDMPFES